MKTKTISSYNLYNRTLPCIYRRSHAQLSGSRTNIPHGRPSEVTMSWSPEDGRQEEDVQRKTWRRTFKKTWRELTSHRTRLKHCDGSSPLASSRCPICLLAREELRMLWKCLEILKSQLFHGNYCRILFLTLRKVVWQQFIFRWVPVLSFYRILHIKDI